jgi:hypothetical protein
LSSSANQAGRTTHTKPTCSNMPTPLHNRNQHKVLPLALCFHRCRSSDPWVDADPNTCMQLLPAAAGGAHVEGNTTALSNVRTRIG